MVHYIPNTRSSPSISASFSKSVRKDMASFLRSKGQPIVFLSVNSRRTVFSNSILIINSFKFSPKDCIQQLLRSAPFARLAVLVQLERIAAAPAVKKYLRVVGMKYKNVFARCPEGAVEAAPRRVEFQVMGLYSAALVPKAADISHRRADAHREDELASVVAHGKVLDIHVRSYNKSGAYRPRGKYAQPRQKNDNCLFQHYCHLIYRYSVRHADRPLLPGRVKSAAIMKTNMTINIAAITGVTQTPPLFLLIAVLYRILYQPRRGRARQKSSAFLS